MKAKSNQQSRNSKNIIPFSGCPYYNDATNYNLGFIMIIGIKYRTHQL